jgi:hypothetical protein
MSNDFRPQVAMGIIILVLALVLIVLTFIPKPSIRIQQISPGGSGLTVPSGQYARVIAYSPLLISQIQAIPSHP